MAYAETTSVEFEKSIAEIVGLLRKAGADQIGQMENRTGFTLGFEMENRRVRFQVTFLTKEQVAKMTGPRQDPAKVEQQWRRQRGRALLLVIKAKLESVESQVETFEQAFLANVMLPGGKTLYESVKEPIAVAYESGQPPIMLLEGPRS